MTMETDGQPISPETLAKMQALSERITAALSHAKPIDPSLQGPGPALFARAAEALAAESLDPAKIFADQMKIWADVMANLTTDTNAPTDKRFQHEAWRTNPAFALIHAQYQAWTAGMRAFVDVLPGLSAPDRKRMSYFTDQYLNAMAPVNFLGLNPEALEKAMATQGESLLQGMENLARDLEAHHGQMQVTLADPAAFAVGRNLAMTPGEVIFRNEIFELIQYTPVTEKVREIPVLIFPPWINKFYILDLKPGNSLVEWLVAQGFTTLVVSWKNPGPGYASFSMDDYVEKGFLTAIDETQKRLKVEQVNAVGYCIAGTTLALTLSRLQQEGDQSVASATFFTTLTDFSDPGEVGVYLDDDFVDGIERVATGQGVLDAFYMSRTFSYLRSNDLIYAPAVKSYLMGEKPPAFDLLFWNSDATNLPARMAVEYLRGLCQGDRFARDGFPLIGGMARLADVKLPVFAVACETDHIAAWRSSFNGIVQMGAKDRRFVLAESGHIAGVINAPARGKYGYWTNSDLDLDPESWKASADHHKGSWWSEWADWLNARSGDLVKARKPKKSLGKAPGTYVLEKPDSP
jgi:polyhydroxyalkanoate synthase subunit PhaC